jgi:hypothetical protein
VLRLPPPLLEGADLVGALSSRTVMLRSPRVWPGRREEREEEARVSVRLGATREGDRARESTPTRIAREEFLERASGRLEIIVTAGGSARAAGTTRLRRDRARRRQKNPRSRRTVELLDGHLRLGDGGVLHDAVAAGAALAAGGDVDQGDGTALAEDAAELVHGGGPGDVTDVETVGGTLSHVYVWCLRGCVRLRCGS